MRAAGGNANNSTNAGAFNSNANNTATNANTNYSSPLNIAKQMRYETEPRHLAKNNHSKTGVSKALALKAPNYAMQNEKKRLPF